MLSSLDFPVCSFGVVAEDIFVLAEEELQPHGTDDLGAHLPCSSANESTANAASDIQKETDSKTVCNSISLALF